MKPIRDFSHGDTRAPYLVTYQVYDPEFPAVFLKIKKLIQDVAGPIVVEHFGSSSIPGLGGRGALDIAIPTPESEHSYLKQLLYGIGFQDSPFPHYLPLLVGCLNHMQRNYAILLYLVLPESKVYTDWLKFRCHMLNNPEDALAYDDVKRQTIARGDTQGEHYQEAKLPFLTAIADKLKGEIP